MVSAYRTQTFMAETGLERYSIIREQAQLRTVVLEFAIVLNFDTDDQLPMMQSHVYF